MPYYVVTRVRYDEDDEYIAMVETRRFYQDILNDPEEMTRNQVVNAIRNGSTFVTGIKTEKGFKKGAEISIYDNEHIRTDRIYADHDNLGSLPEF